MGDTVIAISPAEFHDREVYQKYKTLVGFYQAVRDDNNLNYVEGSTLNIVNKIVDELASKNPLYAGFRLNVRMGNSSYVLKSEFLPLILGLASAVATEFGFEDPNVILNEGLPKNSPMIHNNLAQHQTTSVKVEITANLMVKEIENNLTPKQLEQVKEELETFKSKPNAGTTRALISKLIDVGGDVAKTVLTAILMNKLGL